MGAPERSRLPFAGVLPGRAARRHLYDFVGVFLKDRSALTRYPARILDSAEGCFNARIAGEDEVLRHKRFWGEPANPEP